MRTALAALLAASAACRTMAEQRRTAAKLEPAAIEPTPTAGQALHVARVRVYVDDDYRAQNRHSDQKIERLLQRASEVLQPTIGVRLELAEIRDWNRQSGDDLQGAVAELSNLDPSRDVDLVIGMVSALNRIETDLHQLGIAYLLGHHVVLRGLNDSVEVRVFEEALSTIDEEQRRGLYARRKQHKELVLLLHEIGHTLGAMHVTDRSNILYPSYDPGQSRFGPDNARLMRAVAAAKMGGAATGARAWRAVLERLTQYPWEGWNEDEKAELVTELESRARGEGEAGKGEGEVLGDAVRAADRERFRAAERLEAAGRPLDAWEQLEPLIDFYPDEPGVHRLACRLSVEAKRDRAAVEASCAHAARIGDGDGDPQLRLAQRILAEGDEAKSLAAARQAMELLERSGTGTSADAASGLDRSWLDLAEHFQALRAVTWAEKAAGRTSRGKPVADWARATRVRFGLPGGGPVPPEREAEYLTGVNNMLKDVYSRHFSDAEKRAARLQHAFGSTAGVQAARCDLEVRRHRYPAARTFCRDALRLYPDSAWAHYLIGLLDKRDRKPGAALEHLERAIALYPELKNAYEVAAELYDQLGRAEDRKRLGEAYRAQFSQELR